MPIAHVADRCAGRRHDGVAGSGYAAALTRHTKARRSMSTPVSASTIRIPRRRGPD
jgi:hypothetical protein